jgi:ferrous iron transport protein B
MLISMLLWVLASFGPPKAMHEIRTKYEQAITQQPANKEFLQKEWKKEKLEHSFAGIMGKTIEPVFQPLGYDWKISIALITSFAAREVFVGTMATLYSLGDNDNADITLREKMRQAKRADGTTVYSLATGVSLLIFYVFAMQCMSTLVIVKRETGSWKMPAIQFSYMFFLAYVGALLAYLILK